MGACFSLWLLGRRRSVARGGRRAAVCERSLWLRGLLPTLGVSCRSRQSPPFIPSSHHLHQAPAGLPNAIECRRRHPLCAHLRPPPTDRTAIQGCCGLVCDQDGIPHLRGRQKRANLRGEALQLRERFNEAHIGPHGGKSKAHAQPKKIAHQLRLPGLPAAPVVSFKCRCGVLVHCHSGLPEWPELN